MAARRGHHRPPRNALLRATADGAVWLGHVKRDRDAVKLPATVAFAEQAARLPNCRWPVGGLPIMRPGRTFAMRNLTVSASLHFEFYNGAMGTAQCDRLRAPSSGRAAGRRACWC